MAKYVI